MGRKNSSKQGYLISEFVRICLLPTTSILPPSSALFSRGCLCRGLGFLKPQDLVARAWWNVQRSSRYRPLDSPVVELHVVHQHIRLVPGVALQVHLERVPAGLEGKGQPVLANDVWEGRCLGAAGSFLCFLTNRNLSLGYRGLFHLDFIHLVRFSLRCLPLRERGRRNVVGHQLRESKTPSTPLGLSKVLWHELS